MLPEVVLQRKLQGIHLVSTVSNGSTGYTSPVGKFFEQILSFRGILTNAPYLLVDGDKQMVSGVFRHPLPSYTRALL